MRAVNMECGSLLPLLHRERFPAWGALANVDAECKAAASRRTPKRQRFHAELTAPADVRQSDSCPSRSSWLFPHVSCPQTRPPKPRRRRELQRRRMRPSAQDKRNRLPMNRLRARTSFSNQGQSCPIVPNRVIFLNRSAHTHHSITPPLLPEFGIREFRVFRGRLPFHLFPLNSSYFHFQGVGGLAGFSAMFPCLCFCWLRHSDHVPCRGSMTKSCSSL